MPTNQGRTVKREKERSRSDEKIPSIIVTRRILWQFFMSYGPPAPSADAAGAAATVQYNLGVRCYYPSSVSVCAALQIKQPVMEKRRPEAKTPTPHTHTHTHRQTQTQTLSCCRVLENSASQQKLQKKTIEGTLPVRKRKC